jgi:hypothetical protein
VASHAIQSCARQHARASCSAVEPAPVCVCKAAHAVRGASRAPRTRTHLPPFKPHLRPHTHSAPAHTHTHNARAPPRSWWSWPTCRTRRSATAPRRWSSWPPSCSSAQTTSCARASTRPASSRATASPCARCVVAWLLCCRVRLVAGAGCWAEGWAAQARVLWCTQRAGGWCVLAPRRALPRHTHTHAHAHTRPQACKFIDELLAIRTDKLGPDVLLAAAKTSMGSKVVGAEGDFFGRMVVEAIQAVKTTDQVRAARALLRRAGRDAALCVCVRVPACACMRPRAQQRSASSPAWLRPPPRHLRPHTHPFLPPPHTHTHTHGHTHTRTHAHASLGVCATR